ncbi:MAG TPA: DUF2630 family protein [Candidatus Micrarchaeia archaeon]|nr:DUF2630 family protein [Candidatus Micrarchaeia archaeon]
MRDLEVIRQIESVMAEEDELYRRAEGVHHFTPTDRERLHELQAHLDQCWDLLRQRRARREFGEDPDQARVRPVDVVEHYQG